MSETPETDALESQIKEDHFSPLYLQANWYRDLARDLEKRLAKASKLQPIVDEFLEIADEVADRRRGFMRFLELADRIDPKPDEE
jgi:hypothetical protein